MSVISGKEYLLTDIFSNAFAYTIPAGQRPYSWEEEHAEILFDNLYDFFVDNPPTNNSDDANYYFLGSIVITKKDKIPKSEVIDGQQRLITLTILFSVIAGYLDGDSQSKWYNRIWEQGDEFDDSVSAPRLKIRSKDQVFFEDKIQKCILGKNKLLDLRNFAKDTSYLSEESQRHIRANCGALIKKMDDTFVSNGQVDVNRLKQFCKFLMKCCYIVVVATDNNDTSYRVFTVINTTGMDLLPTDVLKASVIGKIPPADQQNYADKWEDLETDATRQGFRDMFGHIRMIYSKKKAQGTLLKEFDQFVMPSVENAAKISNSTSSSIYLIDKILTPYTKIYRGLKNPGVPLANDDLNFYLTWLNKLDNDDWVPSTMKFFMDKNDADYRLWFVKKMERLSAYMHITSFNINQRIDRYKIILDEMEQNPNHDILNPLKSIELDDEEKKEFFNALGGEIYRLTARRRSYVILRLDSFVATGQILNYNPKILSIEHVLPQTVDSNSQWEILWPDIIEREKWIHKIANLVPLTRRQNSAAQNYDFDKKKSAYFSKGGTISYPLTTQVVSQKVWTPEVVEARQKYLLDILKKNWDL